MSRRRWSSHARKTFRKVLVASCHQLSALRANWQQRHLLDICALATAEIEEMDDFASHIVLQLCSAESLSLVIRKFFCSCCSCCSCCLISCNCSASTSRSRSLPLGPIRSASIRFQVAAIATYCPRSLDLISLEFPSISCVYNTSTVPVSTTYLSTGISNLPT